MSDLKLGVLNALVGGAITFFSQIAVYGYPPSMEALYSSGVASILFFLVTVRSILKGKMKENDRPPMMLL